MNICHVLDFVYICNSVCVCVWVAYSMCMGVCACTCIYVTGKCVWVHVYVCIWDSCWSSFQYNNQMLMVMLKLLPYMHTFCVCVWIYVVCETVCMYVCMYVNLYECMNLSVLYESEFIGMSCMYVCTHISETVYVWVCCMFCEHLRSVLTYKIIDIESAYQKVDHS